MASLPPNQSVDHPLGMGGDRLHEWVIPLRVWRTMHELEGGEVNESTAVVEGSLRNIGASIMGRNMFGGHPGPWDPKKPWTGWWDDHPPFHHPVFVLTHHPRKPLELKGGRRSHLSPRASRRRWNKPTRQPVVRMSPLTVEQELLNNISSPGLSMRWSSTWCRRFSEAVSDGLTVSALICTALNWWGRTPGQSSRTSSLQGAVKADDE